MTLQQRLDQIVDLADLILYAVPGLDSPLAKPVGDYAEGIKNLVIGKVDSVDYDI